MRKYKKIIYGLISIFAITIFISLISVVAKAEKKEEWSVLKEEYLYSIDEEPEYAYTEYKNGGYRICYAKTGETVEYSATGKLPYNDFDKKYYGGPLNYLKKDGNVFCNILASENTYMGKCGEESTPDKKFDSENAIHITNHKISNLKTVNNDYFVVAPVYGHNQHGTCGSVATQILLSYNNYYFDRRIIAPEYLNGGWNSSLGEDIFNASNYTNSSQNPNACYNPESMTSYVLGTNEVFYRYVISQVEPKALKCVDTTTEIVVDEDERTKWTVVTVLNPDGSIRSQTTTPKEPMADGDKGSIKTDHTHNGSKIKDIKSGIESILDNSTVNYTIKDKTNIFGLSESESGEVKNEIDKDRPVILLLQGYLGAVNHYVVAYGYADFTNDSGITSDGFIADFGWGDGSHDIWLNSSWCMGYLALEINHDHTYNVDTNKDFADFKREVRCSECGHRKLEDLYNVDDNGVLTANYNVSGSVTIPKKIGDKEVKAIGKRAFAGCSSLTNITIPADLVSIDREAFVGCNNLNINVDANNLFYCAEGNVLYDKSKTSIIAAGNIAHNLTIPDTVTTIDSYVFYENPKLETLHIYGTPYIGNYAFANCADLTDVYFYSYSVPTLGLSAFSGDNFTLYVPYIKQPDYVSAFNAYLNNARSIPVTISLDSDGTIIGTLDTFYGAYTTGLIYPSKTGYDFVGWYEDFVCSGKLYTTDGLCGATNDITIYAKWTPKKYYITFSGYGCDDLESKEVTYDSIIGELPSITKTGYTFYGWKNQNGEQLSADMIWKKTNNQILSPVLSANKYTIRYDGNGGRINGAESQSVYYDDVINFTSGAFREGYVFVGWNTKADGSGETLSAPYTYTITDDLVLYAQYAANENNVTFDKQGGIGGTDGVNAIYESPMPSGSMITAPTKIGYSFQGYYRYTDGNGTKYYNADMSSACEWNLSDDTTLFAYWLANEYTVTLNKQNGIGGTDSIRATYNSELPAGRGEITAPMRLGYIFQGYFKYENGKGTKYYDKNMIGSNVWDIPENSTIFAYWTLESYIIRLQYENGSSSYTPILVTYSCDMPENIPSPTRDGYVFKGYYSGENGSGKKYYNADMTSANKWDIPGVIDLFACWESNTYTITFDKQGGRGGSSSVTVTYNATMPQNVTAPTKSNYDFMGYYDTMGQTMYYDSNMKSVRNWDKQSGATLVAHWQGKHYAIEYRYIEFMGKTAQLFIDGTLSSAPYYYEYGVGLELSRVTALSYHSTPYTPHLVFLGWYNDEDLTEKATYISTLDTGKKVFYAKWRYDYSQSSRFGDYTITDKDPYTEEYFDTVRLHLKIDELYQELKSVGINYVYLEFKLRIREIDDGYQEVFIFKDTSPTSNPIWSVTDIEHDPSGVCTTAKYYIWRCAFSIDELKDCDYLYIRYGAHGFGKDTWVTDRIYIDTMFTVTTSSDEDIEEFTWDYSAEVKDKDCIPLENVSDSYRKRKNG